jgi:DNA-binding CsgD family transcriptional regulator
MVGSSDLREITRFLGAAYEMGGVDATGALCRPILVALAELIRADEVESFELRRHDRAVLAHTQAWDLPASPPGVDEAIERMRGKNPLGAFKWGPGNGPLRLSRVISRRRLERSEWYHGYLRPLRIRDQLKVWLASTAESAVCVSLDRGDGEFSDRDANVLSVLQPHLALMWETAMSTDVHSAMRANAALTVREAQILTWAATGRSSRDIGRLLFISEATVRKHLEHAYAKLGVRNRAQAMAVLAHLG